MRLFNSINVNGYFIDYIGINIHTPFKELSTYHSELGYSFVRDAKSEVERYFKEKSKTHTNVHSTLENVYNSMTQPGIVLRDKFSNIQINFKAKYFRNTDNISDDYKFFWKDFIWIHNRINYLYQNRYGVECDCNKTLLALKKDHVCPPPKITIFRMDIANNKETFFNNNYQDICKPSDDVIYYRKTLNKVPLITGVHIGDRKTKNIFFRAYDKTIPNKLNKGSRAECVARFGTTEVVRREWELKARFLFKNKINDPFQLKQIIEVPTSLSIIIKKFRKSKDLIFLERPKYFKKLNIFKTRNMKRDTKLYISLHNGTELKNIQQHYVKSGIYLTQKQIKELNKKQTQILLNSHRAKNYKVVDWDSYPQQLGLSKYNDNLSWDKSLNLMRLQVESMRKQNNINPVPDQSVDEIYEQFLIDIGHEIEQFQEYCISQDFPLSINPQTPINIQNQNQFEVFKEYNKHNTTLIKHGSKSEQFQYFKEYKEESLKPKKIKFVGFKRASKIA